jgi:hypothetical protein
VDGSDSVVRVGQVWLVETSILNGRDPKPTRPVVVIRVPDPTVDGADHRVWVVTRTTDMRKEGVTHAADLQLGLDFPGVFADAYVRWGDLADFSDADSAKLLGELDSRTLERLRSRFNADGQT